jgi:hypothetical protein
MAAGTLVTEGMLSCRPDAPAQVLAARYGFEVCRVDAGAIAAQVVQVEAGRDRSDQEFVGKPVGAHPRVGGWAEVAVSLKPYRADPNPACVSLIHALPEALGSGPPDAPALKVAMSGHPRVMHDAHLMASAGLVATVYRTSLHSRYMVAETGGTP